MRHALLALLLILFASPARAAGSPSFGFAVQSSQHGAAVQQEGPGVTNPTACVWNIDDYVIEFGSGDLDSNTTAQVSPCVIADGVYLSAGDDPHVLGVDLYAASAALTVQVDSSGGNADNRATVTPVWDAASKSYRYHWCAGNGVDPPGPYPAVADSSGGYGYEDDVTLTVTNTTGHRVRGVHAWLGVGAASYLQVDCPRTW